MPPVKYCSISKAALQRKYTEENWDLILKQYQPEDTIFARKTIRIWKNGVVVMGIITEHVNPKGTQTAVRLLRESLPEGDIIWDIDHIASREEQLSLPLSVKVEKES